MGLSSRRRNRSFQDRAEPPEGDLTLPHGDAGDLGEATSQAVVVGVWSLPERIRRMTTLGRGDNGAVGVTSRAEVRVAKDNSNVSGGGPWRLGDRYRGFFSETATA